MYEPPRSNLEAKYSIKNTGTIKILLCVFVFLGFVESLSIIDLFTFSLSDIYFVMFYGSLSLLFSWLVWREIMNRPKSAHKFVWFLVCLLIFAGTVNLYDYDSSMFFEATIVILEAAIMSIIALILQKEKQA